MYIFIYIYIHLYYLICEHLYEHLCNTLLDRGGSTGVPIATFRCAAAQRIMAQYVKVSVELCVKVFVKECVKISTKR